MPVEVAGSVSKPPKYTLLQAADHYLKTVENPVSKKEYLSLAYELMKHLSGLLLKGAFVSLPCRLGEVSVKGRKVIAKVENGQIKGLAPDWKATKKLWATNEKARAERKLVYHFNEPTAGIRYRLFWSKKTALVENKTLYALQMTRTNKRAVSQRIQEGTEYFVEQPKHFV